MREDGIAQLEELVRASDNELLARLAFAVGEEAGTRRRARLRQPVENTPPVLVLDGLALRPYLRIPNLFLPVGMALYPPLRRQAVTQLLADDKSQVSSWLVPHDDRSFTPESLPDDAFRPLSEWIDYVLEHEHQAIKTWIGATQFDFEGFVCKDDQNKEKKPKDPPGPKPPKKTEGKDREDPGKQEKVVEVVERKKAKKPTPVVEEEVGVIPNELENRLHEMELAFTALKTPLDDPDRQTLWQEMAQLNGALNHHGDAAICWSNALWETPSVAPQWPIAWFRLESKQPIKQSLPIAQVLRIVSSDTATHANLRLLSGIRAVGRGDADAAGWRSWDRICARCSNMWKSMRRFSVYARFGSSGTRFIAWPAATC